CRIPYGWVLPSTGIRALHRSGVASMSSRPTRSLSAPRWALSSSRVGVEVGGDVRSFTWVLLLWWEGASSSALPLDGLVDLRHEPGPELVGALGAVVDAIIAHPHPVDPLLVAAVGAEVGVGVGDVHPVVLLREVLQHPVDGLAAAGVVAVGGQVLAVDDEGLLVVAGHVWDEDRDVLGQGRE